MHKIMTPLQHPAPTTHLFSAQKLGYRYPNSVVAINAIDLDITSGERIAIVGQNGSGKTTLINLLCGLLPPSTGNIYYKNKQLIDGFLDQSLLEIGVLFQNPDNQLFGHTVLEDVAFGLRQNGFSRKEADEKANLALKKVNLEKMAYKEPHNLSYGQKKRAALAGILAMQPAVLLLDEPTANLDPQQEEILLNLLKDFCGTIICISHDLIFLYEICERAVVLDQGRIQHSGTIHNLVSQNQLLRRYGLDFSFRLVDTSVSQCPEPSVLQKTVFTPSSSNTRDSQPIVSMHDYNYRYRDGTHALKGINLSIHEGERISIVGKNGAGKSTLLSCLIGLFQGEGKYFFTGKAMTAKHRRNLWRQIGMVFQDCADQLFCSSVQEEIEFGLKRLGHSRKECQAKVNQTLSMVRLEGFEKRVPLHLSGGERKRLALACVLAMEPKLLILDEPTAGLDPHGEEQLLEILKNLRVTLLLVSHDLFLVNKLTRRTLVIHQGQILKDLPVNVFMQDKSLCRLNGLSPTYRQRNSCTISVLQQKDNPHP